MENLGPSEIGVLGACLMFIIKLLFDLVTKLLPETTKYTEKDISELQHKADLKNLLERIDKSIERQSDKGDKRAKALYDIQGMTSRDHERIKRTENHIGELKGLIASGDFCNYQPKGA